MKQPEETYIVICKTHTEMLRKTFCIPTPELLCCVECETPVTVGIRTYPRNQKNPHIERKDKLGNPLIICRKCNVVMLYSGDSTWKCSCCKKWQPVNKGEFCMHDIEVKKSWKDYVRETLMKYLLMLVLVLALMQPSMVEAKVRSSVRIAPRILRTVPKKSQPVVLPGTNIKPGQPSFIGPVKPVAPVAPRVWGWNPFRGNFFMWMWFWK